MKALSSDVILDQQKKYLKNLKIDPMTTFHSSYKATEGSHPSENKWPVIDSPIVKEKNLLHIKSNYKVVNPRAKKNQELSTCKKQEFSNNNPF